MIHNNMDEIKIDKFPVFIVANYRTGSTALAKKIGKMYDIRSFVEPHLNNPNILHKTFVNKNTRDIVVKIIANQIEEDFLYYHLLHNEENCFRIKLLRKDKIDQIASYYVAQQRGIWYQSKYEYNILTDYKVEIKIKQIKNAISKILEVDEIIKNLDSKFDLEMYYEDLILDDYDIPVIKGIPPNNMDEIKDIIQEIIKEETISF